MRIRDTPICVDSFSHVKDVEFYLLSHLHADHTAGLTSTWSFGKIYCSAISKAILQHKFKVDSKYIVVIDLEKTVYLQMRDSREIIELTAFDSNHCYGGVMFLLKGYFGTILHTGDFRYDPFMLDDLRDLKIDILFLDDTFIDSDVKFPPRKDAGKEIGDIIEHYPDHKILIASDTLGKEELFISLALRFSTLIVVPHERYALIQEIGKVCMVPNVFTTDPEAGRFHVILKKEMTWDRMHRENLVQPTIGILPTGMPRKENRFVRCVPYSLHSSSFELEEFVKFIAPKKLVSASKHDNSVLHPLLKHCSVETYVCRNIQRSIVLDLPIAKKKKATKLVDDSDCIDLTKDDELDEEDAKIANILRQISDSKYSRQEGDEYELYFE